MLIEGDRKKIFARFEFVVLSFSICFAVAVLAMVRICYVRRNFYLEECSRIAWISRTIPAGRGAILDRNGVPLAWTERLYDLHLPGTPNEGDAEQLARLIGEEAGLQIVRDDSDARIIRRNLSPGELLKIEGLPPGLRDRISLRTRFKRITVDYPEVRRLIGTPPDGVSDGGGLEAAHDGSLRGRDGVFRVMLDRNREWIPRSFEWIAAYGRGEDLRLDLSLEDIRLKAEAPEGK